MRTLLSTFARGGVLSLALLPGLAWSASVSITGPETVRPGELVTYTLSVAGDGIESVFLDVAYDPAFLRFQGATPLGDCLGAFSTCTVDDVLVDDGPPLVVGASAFDVLSGALYAFEFQVEAQLGTTALSLTVSEPPGATVVDAPIQVVPIAPAWLLALSGFGVLAWLQRARRRAA